jgi:Inner membrane protein YgaP-like, transmembrane domain
MSICAYIVNRHMKIDLVIRLLAGTFVLIGTGLAAFVSPWWLLLPAFVGANLIQSAFTGFCPPSIVIRALGWLGEDGIVRWGGRR